MHDPLIPRDLAAELTLIAAMHEEVERCLQEREEARRSPGEGESGALPAWCRSLGI